MSKRFRVAFSFAGNQHRGFVAKVAALLAQRFHRDDILFDEFHEAEFAHPNLAFALPALYKKEADLVVAVFCPSYEHKEWCRLEWRAIYSIIKEGGEKQIMLSRFEFTDGEGLHGLAGFIELDNKTPEQFATLILERLALNEDKPRDHYKSGTSASGAAVPSAAITVTSNLPGGYIGRLFVGRDDFLDQLRTSLQKQTHATAITQAPAATGISGLGGMGKTHAAVEYAHRYQSDYTALLFVCGHSPERLSASLAALCDVLHLNVQGGLPSDESARLAIALNWLATHRGWLLIVDNVDDEDAAAVLTGYYGQFGSGHVLITSRLQNWTDSVEALNIEVLSPGDSMELLCKLTDQKRRRADDDAAQARRLADLLEGLPLALHQAAGYINEQRLTFAEYLAIYEQEVAELLGWFNDLRIPYERPDKLAPRPVLITWKTSFDKLDKDTRFWLLVFAHFAPDPIPEFLLENADKAHVFRKSRFHRLIEALLPFLKPKKTVRKALAQAEMYSLLTRQDSPPRFKLHRLVQHIIRLTASEQDKASALAQGIHLIADSKTGNPMDVRSWPRWNLLQAHAFSLTTYSSNIPVPERFSWLLNELANLLHAKSLHILAEPLMRRALSIDEKRFGPNHPRIAIYLNNLAQMLKATCRLAEAEPLMRRALSIDEANYGSDHFEIATDLNNLVGLLQATNRLEEAEPLMRRVVLILGDKGGVLLPNYAVALNNLAALLKVMNRFEEAEPLMQRALDIVEKSYGEDHPNAAVNLNNLARLLQATERLVEAEPLMRRALSIFVNSLGLEHTNSQTARRNYIGLMKSLKLPESEIQQRVQAAVEKSSEPSPS